MIGKIVIACLLLVGLINFAPVLGLLSAKKLESLYGISLADTNLIILTQHRALLFGLIGGLVLYSIFQPALQLPALIVATISMLGFIVIAQLSGDYNPLLRKIITADIIGLCLAAVGFAAIAFRAASTP